MFLFIMNLGRCWLTIFAYFLGGKLKTEGIKHSINYMKNEEMVVDSCNLMERDQEIEFRAVVGICSEPARSSIALF